MLQNWTTVGGINYVIVASAANNIYVRNQVQKEPAWVVYAIRTMLYCSYFTHAIKDESWPR